MPAGMGLHLPFVNKRKHPRFRQRKLCCCRVIGAPWPDMGKLEYRPAVLYRWEVAHEQQCRPFVVLSRQKHSSLEAGPGVMPATQLPKWAALRVLQSLEVIRHGPEAPAFCTPKIRVIGSDVTRAIPESAGTTRKAVFLI